MHAGARILQLQLTETEASEDRQSEDTWEFSILAKFEEHESMNYGSDVQPLLLPSTNTSSSGSRAIVSTSFYDKKMCLWRF